ncbi:hypothetical protein AB1Y20_020552 [Prymnesium parvum]|uniref:COX assembly mitochondrial protein n=1 Tax=Prymnesium parvum TaxID=97485 RepID=A0AB34JYC5_PRYPA
MHPQLSLENNPLCVEQIAALKECHASVGYWGKLLGSCNDQKAALDKCLRAQKKVLRKAHLDEARAERARWRKACAEMKEQKSSS